MKTTDTFSRRDWLTYSIAGLSSLMLAKSSGASQLTSDLDAFIPGMLQRLNVPGLSIAIIENGEEAWAKGYGLRNADTGLSFQADTVIEGASFTKPIFAHAVLQLVEEGKLDLDTPVTEYVRVEDLSEDPRIEQVTPRLLLSHQSGMPNQPVPDRKARFFKDVGEKFVYSGTGYVCLQKVIETITGNPLEDFVSSRVFQPLKMNDSSLVWRDDYKDRVAAGHHPKRGVLRKAEPRRANAASSLHTTARDFAKFLAAFMAPYGGTEHELKPETRKQMLSREVRVAEAVHWGLGWGLQEIGGEDQFWHWGNNNNVFHHFATGSLSQQRAIVIFTNGQQGQKTHREILSRFNGPRQPALDWLGA